MSAHEPSRRAGVLGFCAACAAIFNPAAAGSQSLSQSLAYGPSDGAAAILQPASLETGRPGEAARDGAELATPLRRQVVSYPSDESPGTVIIDTAHTFLYLTLGGGRAIRYGIGVGRAGFTWSGVEAISRKTEWPDWIPPAEMIARQPYLPRWVSGGPGNPLGARALYLGNTAYRIHGTNDPSSIGKHVSSGCIRLRNEDVIDLYGRVGIGTKVVVLANDQRGASADGQRSVAIERSAGVGMMARISIRPAAAADEPRARAQWGSTPAPFGLY